jgi:hypothetical protein
MLNLVWCGTVAIWKKCPKVMANSDQASTQSRVSPMLGRENCWMLFAIRFILMVLDQKCFLRN